MDGCEGKKRASVQDAIMKAIVQCQMSKEAQDSGTQGASPAEESKDERSKKRDKGDDKDKKPAKKAKEGNQKAKFDVDKEDEEEGAKETGGTTVKSLVAALQKAAHVDPKLDDDDLEAAPHTLVGGKTRRLAVASISGLEGAEPSKVVVDYNTLFRAHNGGDAWGLLKEACSTDRRDKHHEMLLVVDESSLEKHLRGS